MTTSLDPRLANQHGPHDPTHYGRYRAVSAMAVASLVFGVLSVLTVWHWALGLIAVVGILTGYVALRQIRKAPEELMGVVLALAGILLSVAFGVLGYSVLLLARSKEFPYGYQRVDYEILQPDPNVPGERIPPQAYELQYDQVRNNKVGLKGYMYPTRQSTGLKIFLLCPAIPNCPFCAPNPKPTEIIRVRLEGDLEATYTTHLIRVGGKFRVDETRPGGVPYHLDADFFVQPR
jgi:hypothetical protein